MLAKTFLLLALLQMLVYAPTAPLIKNHGTHKLSSLRPLSGHVLAASQAATHLGPVAGNATLALSVVLALNNEEELDRRLAAITDPASPHYRCFMTQDEFLAKYAPTAEQVQKAHAHLEGHGLQVVSVAPNRLVLQASGPVSAANAAFYTELHHYADGQGAFYAPAYELQVDGATTILSVQGLENRVKASRPARAGALTFTAAPSQGLTPAQIITAYSLPPGVTGAGQTLAVFELDAFTQSDITGYLSAFGLPYVPVQVVSVDGFAGPPGDGAVEVTLDIQLQLALAPGAAKLLVYEGPNSGSGLVDTYNKIASDNLAPAVSTSWGLPEDESTGSLTTAENAIFKQMVAQGQVLYAASGDSGAYADGETLGVQDPASQPYVVGVGGTTLRTGAGGAYLSETTWSSGSGPGNEGGGGGISTLWTIPAWQAPAISAASKGSTSMRNVPDVSLDADPNTGYAIFFGGQWTVVGGTSCAAPLWAAFNALVNQQRAAAGQGPTGFTCPALYQIGANATAYKAAIHDIADGSTNGYYPAVTGYDLATGWGTYLASGLLPLLAGGGPTPPPPPSPCSHASPAVAITPTSQTGPAGASLSYTVAVTNKDSSACNASSFALSASMPSGLTSALGTASLTIQPGASAQTTLAVTSSVSAAPQSYTFSVDAAGPYASGTGSASCTVQSSSPGLSLSITPSSGTYVQGTTVTFTFTLLSGQTGAAGSTITLTVHGPVGWSMTGQTNANGVWSFIQYINNSTPPGAYTMSASASYLGSGAAAQATFTVKS
jgi:kumamolisin